MNLLLMNFIKIFLDVSFDGTTPKFIIEYNTAARDTAG